jgi:hypothetical protein
VIDGVTVFVGVIDGVGVLVGVYDGVTVKVGVTEGLNIGVDVGVLVTVIVGVTDGVGVGGIKFTTLSNIGRGCPIKRVYFTGLKTVPILTQ